MPILGSTECRPIGDCAAPFPPAGATIFVDASFTTTDATHFTSLFDAVQSANKNDVVAISPGTYVDDVDIMRSNVTVVGKCAAEVIVKNPGDRRAGILVASGAKGVKVRGVTLTGHYSGIIVKGASEATLEDSIIVKSRYLGAYVAEAGSRLRVARTHIDDVVADAGKFGWGAAAQLGGAIELEDVVVDAATTTGILAGGPKSTGKLTRVVVRSPRSDTTADSIASASALSVVDSAVVELDGAYFTDMSGSGVSVSGGVLNARHLVVTDTKAPTTDSGRGLQVSMKGRLDLSESLVAESDEANVLVIGPGSTATITTSVVRGAGPRGNTGIRAASGGTFVLTSSALVDNVDTGLGLQDVGSHATVDGVLVIGTRARVVTGQGMAPPLGIGVGVTFGSTLDMARSSIVKNQAAGILVASASSAGGDPAHAEIKSTLVLRTMPSATSAFGRGVQVSRGGTATLDGCALVENNEVSLLVGLEGARAVVRNTLVRGTSLAQGIFGHGVVAQGEGTLSLDGAWLLDHAGIAVVVSAGTATITRSLVARSKIGIHVQGGSTLRAADVVPAEPESLACIVSNDTRFLENQTRVGSGEVPLPSPLGN